MIILIATLLAISVAVVIGVNVWIRFHPQFGGRMSSAHSSRYAQSAQWNGKKFVNATKTIMEIKAKEVPGLIHSQLTGRKYRMPAHPLPMPDFDLESWSADPQLNKVVWFGHSAVLFRVSGKNILIDPMLGPNAAPISPFRVKRFSHDVLRVIDQLPPLDLIMLTHDHYDHLDLASIQLLKSKSNQWITLLGVKRHLVAWGIPPDSVEEMDWWDSYSFEDITITCTPSRHFSGRGISDRAKSLWGGFAIKTAEQSLYWTGDGGRGEHFKEVGERLGPFDLAFVECGQYNRMWHDIHMFPEETVTAALDSKSKVAIPVHWAGFALALHPWQEPAERFVAEAEARSQSYALPELGVIYPINASMPSVSWWQDHV